MQPNLLKRVADVKDRKDKAAAAAAQRPKSAPAPTQTGTFANAHKAVLPRR